jgi:hypothetical protein
MRMGRMLGRMAVALGHRSLPRRKLALVPSNKVLKFWEHFRNVRRAYFASGYVVVSSDIQPQGDKLPQNALTVWRFRQLGLEFDQLFDT